MTVPTDTIDKLEECFTALSALCADLTEDEWKRPTDVPMWTVQDHLSHLVAIERTMQGLPGTTHRASDLGHVKNPIGEANEHEVDARRGASGAEVLAEWNDVTEQRLATLRAGDEEYFAQPAMTPTGPGTLADFLHIRVLDCWVHEQDMRRALGRPGHEDGPAAEHTIDRLIRTIPIVVGKRAGTPEGGTVVMQLTGPVQRTIVTTVVEGRARIVDTTPDEISATISMDSSTFTALATGRRTADQVGDAVTTGGDVELAARVVGNLNMMI